MAYHAVFAVPVELFGTYFMSPPRNPEGKMVRFVYSETNQPKEEYVESENMAKLVKDQTRATYQVTLISQYGGDVGHFRLEGVSKNYGSIFQSGVVVNTDIRIDEEYQGKGLSTGLVTMLIYAVTYRWAPRPDDQFYIGADSSEGFWEHVIGMKENPYYDRKIPVEGRGYELVVSWREFVKKRFGALLSAREMLIKIPFTILPIAQKRRASEEEEPPSKQRRKGGKRKTKRRKSKRRKRIRRKTKRVYR